MVILLFVLEICIAAGVFIWMVAMLGFADEANRSRKASPVGKIFALSCIVLATLPFLITLWTIWKYYFSTQAPIPLGLWLLVVSILVSAPVCIILIILYKKSYRS